MSSPATYLYVPGDSGERLHKADTRGAHAIIADLEDGVALGQKDLAREGVRQWLRSEPNGAAERWVRVNPGLHGLADIEAVWHGSLRGVCLAKTDSAADVIAVATLLASLEAADATDPASAARNTDRARGHGRTAIMPLIESAVGLSALREIASAPRVSLLQLGEIDLAADLGMEPGVEGTELLFARSQLVVESRVSRLGAPIGGIHSKLDDAEGLTTSTRQLQRLGFGARTVIHPQQVGTVNGVFRANEHDISAARRLVSGFDAAALSGLGVFRDADGHMVDEAVVRHWRALIERNDERNEL